MIQQALHPFRRGLMGDMPLDAAYMRGVNARARMLARACRVQHPGLEPSASTSGLQADPAHPLLTGLRSSGDK